MKIGKPRRKFLIRVIDLEENRSKNISIYDSQIELEKLYKLVLTTLEKISRGMKEWWKKF